eukprot:scaffold20405_cov129-Isochrysis_galbana.AAC.3
MNEQGLYSSCPRYILRGGGASIAPRDSIAMTILAYISCTSIAHTHTPNGCNNYLLFIVNVCAHTRMDTYAANIKYAAARMSSTWHLAAAPLPPGLVHNNRPRTRCPCTYIG